MNVSDLFQSIQTQDQAIEHLERVRWRGHPVCPYCSSEAVCRHASADRKKPRWQCQSCSRAFSATVGTMFHGTHVPLRNWFLVIALTIKAGAEVNAYQIARDLEMRRPTVWNMVNLIRSNIESGVDHGQMLRDLVAFDLTPC